MSVAERLDEAERLLVSGAFAEAADEAARLLAQHTGRGSGSGGSAGEGVHGEDEDLRPAVAAVLLQGRRLAGDTPRALRATLETSFGSLRAVPPETLELWARLALSDGDAVTARDTLREALAYEPGQRLAHSPDALTQLARVLALDVMAGALKDPAAALKWLAVDGQAVMTSDTRRDLMRQVNDMKQEAEQLEAVAKAQWAHASAEAQKKGGAVPSVARPSSSQRPQQPVARTPASSASQSKRAGEAAADGRASQPTSTGGGALSAVTKFMSRGRAAARADPEGAACVALLAGCALYAVTADRRGLRQALGTVGAAVSHLASMAIGGTAATV